MSDERQARLAQIKDEHYRAIDDRCGPCNTPWPCDATVLLAELEAATARAERAVRAERLSAELLRNLDAAKAQNGRLRECVALFNSMILSGESHSETSRALMRAALAEQGEG